MCYNAVCPWVWLYLGLNHCWFRYEILCVCSGCVCVTLERLDTGHQAHSQVDIQYMF